jgi:glutaredoxin
MAFQFLCPEGHLLQGEESQAGQQCKCPYCGSVFLVPPPQLAAADPWVSAPPTGPARGFDQVGFQAPVEEEPGAEGPEEAFPGIRTGPGFSSGGPPADGPSLEELPGGAEQNIVHILCPSGHQLETPREMLGQDAMCPYCQVQFRLRFEDSVEYRREKAEQRERKELKQGQAWMYWAIAVAVVAVLGVFLLIYLAASLHQ